MNRSVYGREAISKYLSREWDLDRLEDWAVEFGDFPEQREDKWSSGVAGEVLELLRELGDGILTVDEFDRALSEIPAPLTTPR